jgi:hypothetical protein
MNSISQTIIDAKAAGEEGYKIDGRALVLQCEADPEFIQYMNESGFYSIRFYNCIIIKFDKNWEALFKEFCAKTYPQTLSLNGHTYKQDAHGLLGGSYRFGYYTDTDECLFDIIEDTRKECYTRIEEKLRSYV